MGIDRRDFLIKTAGAALITGLMPACTYSENRYLFLSSSHYKDHLRDDGDLRKSYPHFAVFDSYSEKTEVFSVPSLIHSIVQNPVNKLEFLCVPKLGKTAFIYDHSDKSVTPFDSADGFLFYGHAVYSMDGKSIFSAQSVDGNVGSLFTRAYYKGSLIVYNRKTLLPTGDIDTYGNDPHEVQFLDRETVAIANGGEGTNVSIVNLKSGSLIRQYSCNLEGVRCRHLLVDKGTIYVLTMVNGSSGRMTSHLLYPEGNELLPFGNTILANERLRTQLLSGIATEKYIVTTAPKMDAIHFWDKRTRELVRVDDMERAAGIVLSNDKSQFIVTSNYESNAMEYSYDSSKPVSENPEFHKMTGQHTLLARV